MAEGELKLLPHPSGHPLGAATGADLFFLLFSLLINNSFFLRSYWLEASGPHLFFSFKLFKKLSFYDFSIFNSSLLGGILLCVCYGAGGGGVVMR